MGSGFHAFLQHMYLYLFISGLAAGMCWLTKKTMNREYILSEILMICR